MNMSESKIDKCIEIVKGFKEEDIVKPWVYYEDGKYCFIGELDHKLGIAPKLHKKPSYNAHNANFLNNFQDYLGLERNIDYGFVEPSKANKLCHNILNIHARYGSGKITLDIAKTKIIDNLEMLRKYVKE